MFKERLLRLAVALAALLIPSIQTKAQNVGVDVPSPLQKLDVAGGIRIGTTTNGLAGSIRWTGTQFEGHNGTSWQPLGGGGSNWTVNGTHIHNSNTGNVGIGVPSPASKLHLAEGEFRISHSTAAPTVRFVDEADNSFMTINYQRSHDRLELRAQNNQPYLMMRNANGYVGIGVSSTENPTERLHVVGRIRMVDGNEAAGRVMVSSATGVASWADATSLTVTETDPQVSSTTTNYIPKWDGTTLVDGLVFDNGTNIGIGNAVPLEKLHVTGKLRMADGTQGAGKVMVSDANGSASWADAASLTVTETDPQVSSATTNLIPKWNGTTLVDGLVFDNGTNIGIGTTSPAAKLDVVNGNVIIRNTGTPGSSALTIAGRRGGGNTPYNTVNTTAPARIDFQNNDVTSANSDYLAGRIESVNRPGINDGELRFYTTLNMVMQEAMNISSTGNVGIGTLASEKLHVVGSIRMVDGNQAAGRVMVSDANGSASWAAASAVVPNMIADADGNTRIRTEASPNEDIIRFGVAGSELYTMRRLAAGSPYLRVHSPNTLMGDNMSTAVTGVYNTAYGFQAANALTSGTKNTYVGDNAGGHNTTGSYNTVVGSVAGQFNNGGSGNTFIGADAGRNNLAGSGNVFIGSQAGVNETGSNLLFIDNSNTATPLIRGDFATDVLTVNGNLGISTTAPTSKLHVVGTNNVVTEFESSSSTGTWFRLRNTSAGGTAWSWIATGASNGEGAGKLLLRDVAGAGVRMTVDAAGNIGLGTTDPQQKLHVAGSIRMVDGNQATGRVMVSDANGSASWADATSLTVTETDPQVSATTTNLIPKWNGTTLVDGVVFDNGTNIGIGNNSPQEKLHVTGKLRMADGTEGTGKVMVSDANGSASWADATLLTVTETDPQVSSATSNFIPKWNGTALVDGTLFDNGSVGIGTTSPSAPLHVNVNHGTAQVLITPSSTSGQDAAIAIRGARNSSTVANHAQLKFENYDHDLAASNTLGSIVGRVSNHTANIGDLIFNNSSDGTTLSETMRLTSAGNVGIGVPSPQEKLHVAGKLRMADGTQGAGKMLVSDANGSASWSQGTQNVAYAKSTGSFAHDNSNSYDAITGTASINVYSGDIITIMANASVRLTGGSGTDEFLFRASYTGCATGNNNETRYVPSEDSNDHNNFVSVSYLDVLVAPCTGTLNFQFNAANTGDDAWETEDRVLVVRRN